MTVCVSARKENILVHNSWTVILLLTVSSNWGRNSVLTETLDDKIQTRRKEQKILWWSNISPQLNSSGWSSLKNWVSVFYFCCAVQEDPCSVGEQSERAGTKLTVLTLTVITVASTPVLRSGAASARDKIWLKITQFLVETVALVNSPLNLTNITQPVKKLSNKQIYDLPLYKHYNSFITSKLCYFYILPCLTCRNALP